MKNIIAVLVVLFISTTSVIGSKINTDGGDDKKKSITDGSQILGRVYFDLGLNILRDAPSEMSISAFQSKSAGFYYMRQFPIGKKMSFNPSLGVTMEKYSFNKDVAFGYTTSSQSTDSLGFFPVAGIEIKRSKLATSFIEVPVEFRYYFKGNDSASGMYLAFGGFAGIRLETHTKLKFTEASVKKVEKKRENFQQNNLRYGIQGRIGYKGINLFYKHSLVSIFGSNGPVNTSDAAYSTIGISISGL